MRRRINALAQELKAVQQQLAEGLREQPDNQDIRRLGPRCYSMASHCLDEQLTLDPFRYDWQAQFERLAVHILTMTDHPAKAASIFRSVLATQIETANRCQYRYAPEVVTAARPTLEMALSLLEGLAQLGGHEPARPGAA